MDPDPGCQLIKDPDPNLLIFVAILNKICCQIVGIKSLKFMNYRTSFLTFLRLFCLFSESVIQNYGTYPDQGGQLVTDPLDPNPEHFLLYCLFLSCGVILSGISTNLWLRRGRQQTRKKRNRMSRKSGRSSNIKSKNQVQAAVKKRVFFACLYVYFCTFSPSPFDISSFIFPEEEKKTHPNCVTCRGDNTT
jgi:hypothetical protein